MTHTQSTQTQATHPQPTTLKPVTGALSHILDQAQSVDQFESVPLLKAYNRILATPVTSAHNVPPHDNSAVDGYAVQLPMPNDTFLSVSQRITAGAIAEPIESGTIARIFTGAMIPDNANAVVMQENCELNEQGQIKLPATIETGQNIRPKGQDIKADQEVLPTGTRLRAQELGLLASIGVSEVDVKRKLKIAILSTGDELLEPGEAMSPGHIYNSNRYVLNGFLQELDCHIQDFGIVEDSFEATQSALTDAAANCDLILTSGGVSVGEEDHIKAAIESLGELNLWRIAIKPGKPLAFGHIQSTPILGLPGNPGAVFVTFNIFARPFILKLKGLHEVSPKTFKLPLDFTINKSGIRREYLRVKIVRKQGEQVLQKHPNQSSGVLSSACWADGFAIIEPHTTPQMGQLVEFLPF